MCNKNLNRFSSYLDSYWLPVTYMYIYFTGVRLPFHTAWLIVLKLSLHHLV